MVWEVASAEGCEDEEEEEEEGREEEVECRVEC